MKIELVKDWRRAWTWISMNAMVLATTVQTVWLGLPDDMKASVDSSYVQYMTITLLIVGVIGRLIKQHDAE